MNEPSDEEIIAVMRDGYNCRYNDEADHIDFARAVLARWGQPAHSGEPVAWLNPWRADQVTTDYDAYGKHGIPLYTAPQPTQAQAGAPESAEFDQFLSDVLTAAGLVTQGKQCKALGERLADMCMKLRLHGIKGGQHGD